MQVTVNGETREVAEQTTVAALLEALGLRADVTVVQRNGDVVERDRYGDTALAVGDTLELVRFVGGG